MHDVDSFLFLCDAISVSVSVSVSVGDYIVLYCIVFDNAPEENYVFDVTSSSAIDRFVAA